MAAAPSSMGTQFRDELSCSICLQLCTRPKVLPCQHTFCQDCLQGHAGRGGTFQCPNCRREARLPHGGVAGLPDNHLVTNLCEILQRQATLSEETRRQPQSGNGYGPSRTSEAAQRDTSHRHGNQRRRPKHSSKRVKFGGEGSGEGQFVKPTGVAVSDEGEIFVADMVNARIQVFNLEGTFVRQFPTVLYDRKGKMHPNDVAMDGEGNLWAVGGTRGCTEFAGQYTKHGKVIQNFFLAGSMCVRGIAVDTRRNYILATCFDKAPMYGEVEVFRPDGQCLGTVGELPPCMRLPKYVTVDREGRILVSVGDFSDETHCCIYVYNEDGQFLFKFGGEGSGEGQLKDPCGICTDRAGNIIVADEGKSRVEMFDKKGRFIKHIVTDIEHPRAVAVTTHGQLVVTSSSSHSITIFQSY